MKCFVLDRRSVIEKFSCSRLTSGVSAKDEFSDLVVNKDEEAVRERTEPPAGPEAEPEETGSEQRRNQNFY